MKEDKNSRFVTLRIAVDGDGDEFVVPDLTQLRVRAFALDREIEELEDIDNPLVDMMLDALDSAVTANDDAPVIALARARVAALGSNARRAELMEMRGMVARAIRSYNKYLGKPGLAVEVRRYRYHPYTMGERIAARCEAEKVDENTSNVRFDAAVYTVEILRQCLEDFSAYHESVDDMPTTIGDALFEAIKSKSEPTMDEIFFIVASRQTSAKE